MIKFTSNKVVQYTDILRKYLKSETDNNMTIYMDQGKIFTDTSNQTMALVPADKSANHSEPEEDDESEGAEEVRNEKRKDMLDLEELKQVVNNLK